ncbi:VanZ family protein [Roseovarius pelagicus]|uniref:VanZ family protein n=1 Tax=Roseovarius pelagicus TaxID=2980108 RepID=A0ABY6D7W1_9RHOB|nr:VanZ family protein [Roseovarius pelagicus]UXX81999.1 VanZ family protein [Roseovarius pelagicus]
MSIALFLVVGIATLSPMPEQQDLPGSDKLHHLIGFAALAFPLSWVYPRHAWLIFAAATVYGGLIEVIQPQVGRYAEFSDGLADLAGAAMGAGFGRWLGLRRFAYLSRAA